MLPISFIVGVAESSYGKRDANFRGRFPKGELAAPGDRTRPDRIVGWKKTGKPRLYTRIFPVTVRLLGERFYGCCFVVFYVEDGIELCDLQQVVNFLVRLSNLSSPPWFLAVVKALTSSPMPELSM